MAIRDLTSERLFVDSPLAAGARVTLPEQQAHYLVNVLRMTAGATSSLCSMAATASGSAAQTSKNAAADLVVTDRTRPQIDGPDIDYLFAPLKRSRLDYMVQKAVEMGVARLSPVITHRTIVERVNLERMRANAIEAAEQCGVLRVPAVIEPLTLEKALAGWDAARTLIFCDERGCRDPIDALTAALDDDRSGGDRSRVLIGPEGGFADSERRQMLAMAKPL